MDEAAVRRRSILPPSAAVSPEKIPAAPTASLRPMRLATARCGWMMRLDFAAASHYSRRPMAIVQFIDCADWMA